MPNERRRELSRRLIVFYTGIARRASELLKVQAENIQKSIEKQDALRRMVRLTYMMKAELESGNINSFGDILHENWELKKSLTNGISNTQIDEWYNTARRSGASGGKLLGAGYGGFLLLFADEERHPAIAQALGGLRRVDFGFEPLGSRIMFYNP